MKNLLAWLTINHGCNLGCTWCYQRESVGSAKTMPFQLIERLVEFLARLGSKEIILIGGEPTLHPQFLDAVRCVKNNGIKPYVVSNSVRFADRKFLAEAIASGICAVTTSVKGSSRQEYIRATGRDVFQRVGVAIENFERSGIDQQISVTVSGSTITNWTRMVEFLKQCGGRRFHFSFEKPTILSGGRISFDREMAPRTIARFIQDEMYPSLLAAGITFRIELMFPQCVLDAGFVQKVEKEGHAFGGCLLTNRDGVVFGPEGEVLPCNHFVTYPMGKYGVDFQTPEEFLAWRSEGDRGRFYQTTKLAPCQRCAECAQWPKCGAGCRLYWLDRGPAELLPIISR